MVTKAVDRIGWRLLGKPFKTNQNDIDSFNQIVEYVEQTQKQQYQANHLFAKLYIYLFMQILKNDGTTVFDNSARSKIGNILEKPIPQLLEEFLQMLNDSELYRKIDKTKTNGVIPEGMDHIHEDHIEDVLNSTNLSEKEKAIKVFNWRKERIKNQEALNKMFKENPDAFVKGVWDYDTVEKAVMSEVNQMINLYL